MSQLCKLLLNYPTIKRDNKKLSYKKVTLKLLNETSALVDHLIDYYIAKTPLELHSFLECALKPKGSRERALLVRLGWELINQDFTPISSAMASVEFLHFSTLVIDDFLDKSPLRGGEETVANRYGVENAVITGEILQSLSIRSLIDVALKSVVHEKNLLAALRLIQKAHREIYLGQHLDIAFEQCPAIREDEYMDMVSMTTGSLMEASILIGAILRNASDEEMEALGQYGRSMGIALQITDDLLELIADPSLIGKILGGDLRQGKKRLPIIHALKHASYMEQQRIRAILGKSDASEKEIAEVTKILKNVGSLTYCQDLVVHLCGTAMETLEEFPASEAKYALLGFSQILENIAMYETIENQYKCCNNHCLAIPSTLFTDISETLF